VRFTAVNGSTTERTRHNGPIVRTSNFNFASTAELKRFAEGKSKAYLYTRYGNPTLAVAEPNLRDLENGEAGWVTVPGMAAISSLCCGAEIGDEVNRHAATVWRLVRLFRDTLPRLGIRTHFVDADLAGVDALVSAKTRALYVESPTIRYSVWWI